MDAAKGFGGKFGVDKGKQDKVSGMNSVITYARTHILKPVLIFSVDC